MEVSLHKSIHTLPFWTSPRQSNNLFEPKTMRNYVLAPESRLPGEQLSQELAKNHWVWPILDALKSIENKRVMAHAAVLFKDGKFYPNDNLAIQITTLPADFSSEGIPLVLNEGRVVVKLLWMTMLPSQKFLLRGVNDKQKFWKESFCENLRQVSGELDSRIANDKILSGALADL